VPPSGETFARQLQTQAPYSFVEQGWAGSRTGNNWPFWLEEFLVNLAA
jgi:hypothetical protein